MKASALQNIDVRAIFRDFQDLNPKDVGTWPLVPRVAILLALFLLILLGGWWFFWDEQLVSLENKQQTELKLRDEFVAKKKLAVNLDLYVQRLNEIDRSFGALLKQLPNKSEVEALLVEINQAGMGRGLQFELFKPGAEQVKDFYAELPINVRLTGSYHDFGAFAGDIGKLSRIVTLNNIAIAQGKDGGLVMDAITKTFRYLDEEELAAKRKAAQAAKAGKK
ncbi:MAG: type 4a pilus biogenesis protein PilO [Candidatus Accumulibacter phosphatis]|uniref:Pilus assembly protein, PilO n=2 Tax=Candidatus Accumulibacter TaxID=327159 RepID=A0A080MKX7_9PROT|nr:MULTISPECIES: type 4a pilus biogenesis protein PilO [Candidatus Accumulibacter]KFB78224.1 MAG: Pilus assembly protein, PilO [Candidatus Accumulibacter cognatus]MBL8400528.1 type 4a pilus biogenesis protein PilO [Accumulibacter sp.]MBN8517924.1 type 4a pilus biogenesis protein PilO [Accumulibacter sp.]MBO3712464.1 type 4a pilus biogenesis protein PilO [Accumulibacter sp.]MCC2866508.1 type 4a pilus biogenesis protein PilO [Candidatus Accumulibacter phosphatis]